MKPFSRQELQSLFDGKKVSSILPYPSLDGSEEVSRLLVEGSGRLSISGAQTKYSMVEDGGVLRFARSGEPGRYILKPIPTDYRFYHREDMPANEHLTMQIAHKVYRLSVAAHGLVWFGDGAPAYLTRRFDYLPNGRKAAMEDLASIAGLSRANSGEDYKYHFSYEHCAEWIARYCPAVQIELLTFFRFVLFNYLFCNADAHLKNFSLLDDGRGFYRLSPGYDLLNTLMHIPSPIFALDKGLFKEGTPVLNTTPIGRPMFERFGHRIGIPERMLQRELCFFANAYPQVGDLIEASSLSGESRQAYRNAYEYRLSTMQ